MMSHVLTPAGEGRSGSPGWPGGLAWPPCLHTPDVCREQAPPTSTRRRFLQNFPRPRHPPAKQCVSGVCVGPPPKDPPPHCCITHQSPRPCRQLGDGESSGGHTWVEQPRLQGGLEGHEQLLPLVRPLQAVLEVLDGRPGVREVCGGGQSSHAARHTEQGAGRAGKASSPAHTRRGPPGRGARVALVPSGVHTPDHNRLRGRQLKGQGRGEATGGADPRSTAPQPHMRPDSEARRGVGGARPRPQGPHCPGARGADLGLC